MFSEISLNILTLVVSLKDWHPHNGEKTVFTRFSFMMMMLKFVERKFFMSKIETATFEGKNLRNLQ